MRTLTIFNLKECILQTFFGHFVHDADLRHVICGSKETVFVPKYKMDFHLNGAFELAAGLGSDHLLSLTDNVTAF